MIDYKELTEEDQLNLLSYCWGEYCLNNMEHYHDLKYAPQPNPNPHKLLISSILGIDFEELYNSEKAQQVSKYLKNNNDFIKSNWWFIGDSMQDVIWNEFEKREATKKTIKQMLDDIKLLLDVFYQEYLKAEKEMEDSFPPPIPVELYTNEELHDIINDFMGVASFTNHEDNYLATTKTGSCYMTPSFDYLNSLDSLVIVWDFLSIEPEFAFNNDTKAWECRMYDTQVKYLTMGIGISKTMTKAACRATVMAIQSKNKE